jgi:hypothetical protein|tara:strand:+ start:570 stop:812 length:243 start_codon:yes stop_codon:yes gene_type:complete
MELIIDEEMIDKYIQEVSTQGQSPHKGIYSLLLDFKMLGYLYRGSHSIRLIHKEHDADISEGYANYLDKKASGINVDFKA